MTIHIIILLIISLISWGLFDVKRKILSQNFPLLLLITSLMFGQSFLYLIWVFFDTPIFFIFHKYYLWGLLNIALNTIANLLFFYSIKIAPLSNTIPMLTFATIFTSLGGFIFLGETLNYQQIIAIVLIIIGSFLLNGLPKMNLLKNSYYLGPYIMLLVALIWSICLVIDKICFDYTKPSLHGFIQISGLSILMLIILNVEHREPKDSPFSKKNVFLRLIKNKLFYFAIIVSSTALATQLIIIKHIPVGIYETFKRSSGIIFSFIFGYIFFKEKITYKKISGIILIMTSIWLIL